jgi:hypothetical protein
MCSAQFLPFQAFRRNSFGFRGAATLSQAVAPGADPILALAISWSRKQRVVHRKENGFAQAKVAALTLQSIEQFWIVVAHVAHARAHRPGGHAFRVERPQKIHR